MNLSHVCSYLMGVIGRLESVRSPPEIVPRQQDAEVVTLIKALAWKLLFKMLFPLHSNCRQVPWPAHVKIKGE